VRTQPIRYPHHDRNLGQAPGTIAVGAALRHHRTARGISLRKLATMIDGHASVISSWETGKRTPDLVSLARILGVLDLDQATTNRITDQAVRANHSAFVDADHRDHAALSWHYEHLATHTTTWAPTLVPDLLRTPAHDLYLLDHPLTDTDDADARSLAMPERRDAFDHHTRRYTFLIGATALDACPPPIHADQLALLGSEAARPNITIRIVPAGVCPPGLITPFTLYQEGKTTLVVAVHHHLASTYLAHRETLAHYHRAEAWLRHTSLDVTEALISTDGRSAPDTSAGTSHHGSSTAGSTSHPA
jgi:transcriptional regulator with XRE-family HTH domain